MELKCKIKKERKTKKSFLGSPDNRNNVYAYPNELVSSKSDQTSRLK